MKLILADRAAVLALAKERVHPQCEFGTNDEFVVTTVPSHPHKEPYTWRCGYLGTEGTQVVMVDTQGDEDQIVKYVPHSLVNVELTNGIIIK